MSVRRRPSAAFVELDQLVVAIGHSIVRAQRRVAAREEALLRRLLGEDAGPLRVRLGPAEVVEIAAPALVGARRHAITELRVELSGPLERHRTGGGERLGLRLRAAAEADDRRLTIQLRARPRGEEALDAEVWVDDRLLRRVTIAAPRGGVREPAAPTTSATLRVGPRVVLLSASDAAALAE
ncbi:MAG: hypothetical protein H6710_19985 [Myxococcales bacterium]|nr:hypothetical protein [Myxococcales bacterium]MCB9706207.1 hypothetical protein [Myxococcales bacterium]